MSEKFKRSWRGWIRSSEGFDVRLLGRNNLEYRDETCHIHLFAEPVSEPWTDIRVFSASIPDTAELSRSEVTDRLARAFRARGWNLLVDEQQQR